MTFIVLRTGVLLVVVYQHIRVMIVSTPQNLPSTGTVWQLEYLLQFVSNCFKILSITGQTPAADNKRTQKSCVPCSSVSFNGVLLSRISHIHVVISIYLNAFFFKKKKKPRDLRLTCEKQT